MGTPGKGLPSEPSKVGYITPQAFPDKHSYVCMLSTAGKLTQVPNSKKEG